MNGWTPLFQQIVASSIWGAPDHVRIAWITILASADKNGIAPLTIGGLRRLANISQEHTMDALRVLTSPDPDSLDPENEGRRIARCDGGYIVLNFLKYRDKAKRAMIREQNRAAQAEWRKKQRGEVEPDLWLDGLSEDLESKQSEAELRSNAKMIISAINAISGKKFRPVDESLVPIMARLKEDGVTFDGVRQMLERQWKAWEGEKTSDGKPMQDYFTPETLFRPKKFNNYYAAKDQPVIKSGKNKPGGSCSVIVGDGAKPKNGF